MVEQHNAIETSHQNPTFHPTSVVKIKLHSTVGQSEHEPHTQVVILSHKCVYLTTSPQAHSNLLPHICIVSII